MTKPTIANLQQEALRLRADAQRFEARFYEEKKRADDLERDLGSAYKQLDTLRGRLLEQQAALVEYALALAGTVAV